MIQDDAVRACFNTGGHPGEWTVHLPGHHLENYIPESARVLLAQRLGAQFYVDNRGSRLEITSSAFEGGREPLLETITAALSGLAGDAPVVTTVEPYQEKPRRLHLCRCGCGQELTMPEVAAHLRAQRAA